MKIIWSIMRSICSRTSLLAFLSFLCIKLSAQNFQLNGDASQKDCDCVELTPAQGNQNGSAWNLEQLDLTEPFDLNFRIYLGNNSNGADGMAFVLQQTTLSQPSTGLGGGLGTDGISPSLAVLFDIFTNPSSDGHNDPTSFFGTRSHNHISLHKNGGFRHGGDPDQLVAPTTAFSNSWLEDGVEHDFQATWNPTTQIFTASVDGVELINYNGDIITDIFGGDPLVFWGFTAATGGSFAEQYFCAETLTFEPVNNSTSICSGDIVDFSSFDNIYSGTVSSYSWDFGDGSTPITGTNSTISKPSHTYTGSNTTAVLTFNIDGSCDQQQEFDIQIGCGVPVDISASSTSVCAGEEFDLTITGTGTITSSPTYSATTLTTGTQTISLTQTTTFTIDDGTTSDNVTVTVAPSRNLTVNIPSDVCSGNDVTITTPQSSLPNYQWQASSDGVNFANIPETSFTFSYNSPPVGDYFLRYYSENGSCADTSTVVSFSVIENPVLTVNSTTTTCSYEDATIDIVSNGTLTTITDPVSSINLNNGINLISLSDTTEFTVESTIGICPKDFTFKINVINDFSPQIEPIPDDQCKGLEPVLNILNSEVTSVRWQVSHDGSSFLDTLGTALNYNLGALPEDDYYFRALFAHDGCEDTSAVEYFRVFQALSLEVNSPASVCENERFDLEILHDGNLVANSVPVVSPPLSSGVNNISLTSNTNFAFDISDANGCENDTSFTISVLPPTAITQEPIADVCAGENVEISATRNDLPNYQWQVSFNGGAFNDTLADFSSYSLSGLESGVYDFRLISNIGGCDNISNVERVEVKTRPALSVTGPARICEGQDATIALSYDGNISVNSTPNYTYSFSTGLNNNVSPAVDTDFEFTATENGCDSTVNYRLELVELVPVSITAVNNSCGEDVLLEAVSVSTDPYVWQVAHNSSGIFNDTLGSNASYALSNLYEGNYDFRVSTTVNGCLNTSPIESFSFFNKPNLNVTGPVEICEGEDATLEVSHSGSLDVSSSTSYTFPFVNGTNNNISPPTSTSFEFKATENGCDSLFTYSLGVVPKAPLSVSNISDVCFGEEVLLSADQKGLGTYNWQIANGNSVFRDTALTNTPDVLLSNLQIGSYQFRFESGSCSNTSAPVSFEVKPRPNLTLGSDSVSCPDINQTLTFTTDIGTVGFNALETIRGTINQVTGGIDYNLSASLLVELTATENACESKDTVNLRIIEPTSVAISGLNEICSSDVEFLSLIGVFTSPEWKISKNSGPLNDTLSGEVLMDLSSLPSGDYEISATVESNGCLQEVGVHNLSVFDFSPFTLTADTAQCLGGSININLSGVNALSGTGLSGTTYTLVSGDNTVSFAQSDQVVFSTGVGACATSDTVNVEVFELLLDLSSPQQNAEGKIVFEENLDAELISIINSHPYTVSYSWSYNGLSVAGNTNSITESISSPGVFVLEATSAVCTASASLEVIAPISTEFTFPTLFTPNGDDDNDLFVVEGLDLSQENYLTIKNRWGTDVLSRKRMNEYWDGTFNGNPVPEGTYYYVLESGEKKISGYITVLR